MLRFSFTYLVFEFDLDYVDVELCLNICLVSQQRFNSIKGWFDGEQMSAKIKQMFRI